ncbi:MAG: hypothetical protein AAF928_05125 [Myxococcota bacterium]
MKETVMALGLASVMALVLPGCRGKVQQCNDLIKEINATQNMINGAATAFSDKDKAKKIYDDVSAEIDKIKAVEISDEKLKEKQQKWVDELTAFNKTMKKVTEVTSSGDAAGGQAVIKDITDTSKKISDLVTETNKYCQGG